MFYIPNIGDYLKILTDIKVKDLVVISFGEYFKSMKEKLYSKLFEELYLSGNTWWSRKICENDAVKFFW